MIDFAAAFTGLKFAKEALTFTLNQKIESEVKEKVSDALSRLGAVQDDLYILREELLKIQDDNYKLKEIIREQEEWDKSAAKYSLVPTPAQDHIYKFSGSPEHYACPVCFTKKEIHILQWHDKPYKYECKNCSSQFTHNDYPADSGVSFGISDYDPLNRY